MDSPTFSIRQKYGITDRKHKQDSSQSELSIREIIKKYSILETDSKLKLQISSNNKYSSKEVDSEPKIQVSTNSNYYVSSQAEVCLNNDDVPTMKPLKGNYLVHKLDSPTHRVTTIIENKQSLDDPTQNKLDDYTYEIKGKVVSPNKNNRTLNFLSPETENRYKEVNFKETIRPVDTTRLTDLSSNRIKENKNDRSKSWAATKAQTDLKKDVTNDTFLLSNNDETTERNQYDNSMPRFKYPQNMDTSRNDISSIKDYLGKFENRLLSKDITPLKKLLQNPESRDNSFIKSSRDRYNNMMTPENLHIHETPKVYETKTFGRNSNDILWKTKERENSYSPQNKRSYSIARNEGKDNSFAEKKIDESDETKQGVGLPVNASKKKPYVRELSADNLYKSDKVYMDNSFLHIRELVESPLLDKKSLSVVDSFKYDQVNKNPTDFNGKNIFYELNTYPCDNINEKDDYLKDKVDLASSKYASSKDNAYQSNNDSRANKIYNQMNQKINELQKLITEPTCIDDFNNTKADPFRNNYRSNAIPQLKENKKLILPQIKIDTKISNDSNSWHSMLFNKENNLETLYQDDESIRKFHPKTNRESYINSYLRSKSPTSHRNNVKFERPKQVYRNLSPISNNSFMNFENLNPNIYTNMRKSYNNMSTNYQSRHRSKSPNYKTNQSISYLNITRMNTQASFENKPIVTNFKNIRKLANLEYDDMEKEQDINQCMQDISKNMQKIVRTEIGNVATTKNIGKFSQNEVASNYGLNLRNSANLNTPRDHITDCNSSQLNYNAKNCTDTYSLQVASEKHKLKELYEVDLDIIQPSFKDLNEFFKKREEASPQK